MRRPDKWPRFSREVTEALFWVWVACGLWGMSTEEFVPMLIAAGAFVLALLFGDSA